MYRSFMYTLGKYTLLQKVPWRLAKGMYVYANVYQYEVKRERAR